MDDNEFLARRFEEQRAHLRAVAFRMLGTTSEAEDAVQESWLRLSRSDASEIDNLGGWLTTVVGRVCLDMLRARKTRGALALDEQRIDEADAAVGPEQQAMVSDSIGIAMLVVLDRLSPPERLAFVLHDMFAVPFEEIAPMVDRSPEAARQLASRARRRVQGAEPTSNADVVRQRSVVDAFMSAVRGGDFAELVAVLDPDAVLRAYTDQGTETVRGAEVIAGRALSFSHLAPFARPGLVNGSPGVITVVSGAVVSVMDLTIVGSTIVGLEVINVPERLAEIEVTLLEG